MELVKHRRGRPMKYGRASRAVTITLPEDVLSRLHAVDLDLGRAIVSIVEGQLKVDRLPAPAEVSAYGNHAVIVVTPARALKRLPGVELVPIGNGRALISLDQPRSTSQLELDVRDAIEHTEVTEPERQTLEAIAGILRQARRSRRVTIEERTIIVLDAKRSRRSA